MKFTVAPFFTDSILKSRCVSFWEAIPMARRQAKGPQFIRYFGPIINALKELGGSGRPSEVKDLIVEQEQLSDSEQEELTESGVPRFSNQVDWARFYLVRSGYLDASVRGVWTLTDQGRQVDSIGPSQALAIFRSVREQLKAEKDSGDGDDRRTEDGEHDGIQDLSDYRVELIELLKTLPAAGFERLCQRLLRESGFERVTVTGRSGDGGIDGIGVLQMTPFVSFKVLFQSKRYAGSVSAPQIRDFRGAMLGRAEKGIILTTGTFTRDARNEAARDGVEPIELVDGEELVSLFESLELGLKPRIAYDVDYDFFEQFQ
jgi:restriction system protein